MKGISLLSLLFLFGPAALSRQAAVASIEGVVQRAGDNEPIAGVKVELTRTTTRTDSSGAGSLSILTDSEGHFKFTANPGGPYRLTAIRNGYMRMEYGQRGRYGRGTEFNLASGQVMKGVSIVLTPQSSINGRVLDENGEPVEGVTVQLQKYKYTPDGRRTLDTVRSDITNDRGEYRHYWFDAGRYYLLVSGKDFPLVTSFKVGDASYSPTYYGGVVNAAEAVAIDIRPGADLTAIDVVLSQQQHHAYRISGTIVDSTTGRSPQFAQVGLTRLLSNGGFQGDQKASYFDPAKGTFEIGDLAPGTYWVSTQVLERSPGGSGGRTTSQTGGIAAVVEVTNRELVRSTQMKVTINSSDVENVVLNATIAYSITGHLTIDGQSIAALPSSPGIRVDLVGNPANSSPPESPVVNKDGTFDLRSVPIGEYRVRVRGIQGAFYIKDVRLGADDILGQTFPIRGPITATLEVTVSLNPGAIEGTVVDELSKAVAGIPVVLIPDRQRDRLDLYKTATTDSNGKFSIGSVTPGDYSVFSWEDLDTYSYFDPAVVREFDGQGKAVHISELSKETIQIRMIPATP